MIEDLGRVFQWIQIACKKEGLKGSYRVFWRFLVNVRHFLEEEVDWCVRRRIGFRAVYGV